MLKRFFDIVVSITGIIFLSPVLLSIALLIKMDSQGAVIYRGMRTGRFGASFYIYKFRTMVENAEIIGGGTTALNDSRITGVGRIIRKFKLDEIPQLFNVLKGEMSIVGPRPELLQYTQQYTQEESCILDVRPGITDISSIEFSSLDELVGEHNADQVFEEKILKPKNNFRIQYVMQQNFWLDLKLILLTVWIITKKIWIALINKE